MKTTLMLIRHAQSTDNARGANKLQEGHDSDAWLTDLGVQQAQALGKRLAAYCRKHDNYRTMLYSSPMARAWNTASEVSLALDKTAWMSAQLCEVIQPGWHEVPQEECEVRKALSLGADFMVPGGECFRQKAREMETWLFPMVWRPDTIDADQLIIGISHGLAIRSLLWRILGFDAHYIRRITLENTSICQLHITSERGWVLDSINDHAHLEGLNGY